MDDALGPADSFAAASLAAARCAALGRHEIADYFEQYAEFERLFREKRAAEEVDRRNAFLMDIMKNHGTEAGER